MRVAHLGGGGVHVQQQQRHGGLLQVGLARGDPIRGVPVEEVEGAVLGRNALPLACASSWRFPKPPLQPACCAVTAQALRNRESTKLLAAAWSQHSYDV